MRRAIAATGLDLSALTVLTEAASGAYGVTAVIAAMAGAKQVHAFVRPSPYGSVWEVNDWTSQLANAAGTGSSLASEPMRDSAVLIVLPRPSRASMLQE